MVIGGNGSGKTTFSVKLAELTSLPLTHLDRLFWRDNWQRVPREEFDAALAAVLSGDQWVIDGNFLRTIPVRMKCADTVIWFDFPAILCFFGVTERFFKNYGRSRDDMGGYCPERLDREKLSFLFSVFRFNKTNRPQIRAALAENPGVKLVVFKNRRQADRFLASLAQEAASGREESSGREEIRGGEEKGGREENSAGEETRKSKTENGKKERSDGSQRA